MKILKDYGLSITLFAMFALSWLGQYLTHDKSMTDFWNATFENWQSEFLQIFTFIVLTTYLYHKNSPESRDGDDEMQAKLDRIEKRLEKLDREEIK